jgi:hypothetical protein
VEVLNTSRFAAFSLPSSVRLAPGQRHEAQTQPVEGQRLQRGGVEHGVAEYGFEAPVGQENEKTAQHRRGYQGAAQEGDAPAQRVGNKHADKQDGENDNKGPDFYVPKVLTGGHWYTSTKI